MIWSLAFTATVLAATAPATARDARLVSHRYNAEEVVRIDGRAGVQATIAFAEDEHIENVAIGDSASWQVTPNKRANLLFVKPLAARARTNLTVVTDRNRYFFDLVATPGGNAIYVLRFTYPEAPSTPAPALANAAMTEEEARAIEAKPVPAPTDPATLNFAWTSRGERKLMPARIYDDGTFTYLAWSAGTPIPAFLERNQKGEEGPVNFSVRGDVIVVEGVPKQIVLRAGKESALLTNEGPARAPSPRAEPQALASARTQTQTQPPIQGE